MRRAIQAQREVASLNACFESHEMPPENGNQPEPSILTKAAIHTVASDRVRKEAACRSLPDRAALAGGE
jgi:hypothetical protein